MTDLTYRLRSWLLRPEWLPPAERHQVAALISEVTEPDAPILKRWELPSGRVAIVRAYDHDGVARELEFRRYARRSGERVCSEDHEHLTGRCIARRSSV